MMEISQLENKLALIGAFEQKLLEIKDYYNLDIQLLSKN